MNAISVDRANWQRQGVPPSFGDPAARLADAYVRMAAGRPSPVRPICSTARLNRAKPSPGRKSNAVIFAQQRPRCADGEAPDFLDLCIALTGRAPLSGVLSRQTPQGTADHRRRMPAGADDAFWPLIG